MGDLSSSLSLEQKAVVARTIEQTLWDKNLTKKHLVGLTKLGSDTIYEALNKKRPVFTDKTIFKIERVLGKKFLATTTLSGGDRKQTAPEHMGGYTLTIAKPYIGEYVCVRPAFQNPKNLYVYLMDIEWSDEDGHLVFQEKSRQDIKYTNRGSIYLPRSSPIVNLVTIAEGKVRHIVASHIDGDGVMLGLLQTLFNPFAAAFVPVSAPFMMKKTQGQTVSVGEIDDKKSEYKAYRQGLEQVSKDGFGKYIGVA